MSLKSWKAEFYPIPACKTKKEDAIAHSLRKWQGALPENLKKHEVIREGVNLIFKRAAVFRFGSATCALCYHFLTPKDGCSKCPLFISNRNTACDDSSDERMSPYHYAMLHYSAEASIQPMIFVLEKALEWQASQPVVDERKS